MIKTIIAGFFLVLISMHTADAQNCLDKVDLSSRESIYKLCNKVDDILCQHVDLKERRTCGGGDVNMSSMFNDVARFAESCLKASYTSIKSFVLEFVPELVSALWEATKSTAEFASGVLTSSGSKEKSWSSKIKGMYESARSISADVFHAFSSNPKDFLSNLWSKLEEAIGPTVDSYFCLKPELKVARVCSFITAYAIPISPVFFAKALTKGIALAKKYKENSFAIEQAVRAERLQKRILQAQNRKKLTVKQYHQTMDQYRALGYSEEEFEFLYKSGAFEKIKLEKLKDVNTAAGKAQKQSLLKEFDEYEKSSPIITDKTVDEWLVKSKKIEKETLRREILRNEKVYNTQIKLISDLQKSASQIIKQSGNLKGAQASKVYSELNLIRASELEMQRDLLQTTLKLKKQDVVKEIEKRIQTLEKVIDKEK